MEVDAMAKEEQAIMLIDVFTDLKRIKGAANRDKKIDAQLLKTKVKLETLGVAVDNLPDFTE